jgi:hypothetical protein
VRATTALPRATSLELLILFDVTLDYLSSLFVFVLPFPRISLFSPISS